MANKITKSEMFKQIASHLTDVDEINFINHEIELLANKAERAKNATKKPSKVQIENETLKSEIANFVATNGDTYIKDVVEKFDITSQKATPLMNALVDDGKLAKRVEKRKAIYTVA